MLTKDEFDQLDNYTIVLDTNIFLHLYQYPYKVATEILTILKAHHLKIWIPHQVYIEFLNNYHQKKGKELKRYDNFKSDMGNIAKESKSKMDSKINVLKEKYFDIKEFKVTLDDIYDSMNLAIEEFVSNSSKEFNQMKEFLEKDEVLKFLNLIKARGNVGENINFSERVDIIKEGEFRYTYKLPPGYEDKDKDGLNKFGDLFIWKEIMNYTKQTNSNILFITDDVKEDWWELDKKEKPISIRKELKQEFIENNPSLGIEFITMEYFYKLCGLSIESGKFLEYENYVRRLRSGYRIKKVSESLYDYGKRVKLEDYFDAYGLSKIYDKYRLMSWDWDISESVIIAESSTAYKLGLILEANIIYEINHNNDTFARTKFVIYLKGLVELDVELINGKLSEDYKVTKILFSETKTSYDETLIEHLSQLIVDDTAEPKVFDM